MNETKALTPDRMLQRYDVTVKRCRGIVVVAYSEEGAMKKAAFLKDRDETICFVDLLLNREVAHE